jgi:glutathione S-transferase
MDLFISPMSCSFAVHVACLEAGVPVTLHRVERASKRLPDGSDYRAIVPLGLVPALGLPDGSILTECAAVLQYIADSVPEKRLAPPWGTPERYRLIEWLNFITTELHKKHAWPIFSTKPPEQARTWARATVDVPLAHAAARLQDRDYVLGDTFTVADAYLFWVLFVLPHGAVSLDAWPSLTAYTTRIRTRPTVRKALDIEGTMYAAEMASSAQTQAAAAAAPA